MSKKILIVDDDELLRSIYVELFKQAKYEVLEGKDGLEGMTLAVKERPDFIFTGIMMPNMDGFEMIQQLKGKVETAKTPFAIFSHLGREEDRVKAVQAGAKAFFIKGDITPKEILDYITDFLNNQVVFKVAVDPLKFDAQELQKNFPDKSELILLLERDFENPQQFKAKIE